MNRKTNPRRGSTAVGVLLLFFVLGIIFPSPSSALMTPKEEADMGKEVLQQIKRSFPLVKDESIEEYINKVGHEIVEHVGHTDFPYEFFVVDNGGLNAFAVPGGYIFIYRGLIDIMSGESELASVLSHEIGHVQARHIARRMEQSMPLNIATMAAAIAAVLAGGGKAATAIIAGATAANASFQLAYSRQNEEEADRLGMKYLEASDYDVRAFPIVFRKMVESKFLNSDAVPTYLSTHPGLNDRIVYMENMINAGQYPVDEAKEDKTKERFLEAKVRLIALYDQPEAGTSKLEDIAKAQGGSLPHFGMGLLLERARRNHEAMQEYYKAIKLDPDKPEYLTQLGSACYSTGNCTQAAGYLDRALKLDPDNPRALLYMARVRLEDRRYKDAQKLLEKLKHIDRDDLEVYQYLGLAYGRDGQLSLAHEYYAVYFERSGDLRNARYHYDKALEYAQDGTRRQALKDRIRELENPKKKKEEPPVALGPSESEGVGKLGGLRGFLFAQ